MMKLTEGFGRAVYLATKDRPCLITLCFLSLLLASDRIFAQEHALSCPCVSCSHVSPVANGENLDFDAFRIGDRWFTTATDGFDANRGNPRTLTYGVVPDGTAIGGFNGEPSAPSDLVSFLNTNIGPSSVWLPLIQDAYERWGEISGLTMVYEPNDDGAPLAFNSGVLGVRADMRIGGHFIDGQSGSNTLAYNFFPDNSDQVVDTSNTSFFGNSSNNYVRLRNVMTHEAGHGLGFSHFESNNSAGLMEPFINTSFDGPQHDDILAAQRN